MKKKDVEVFEKLHIQILGLYEELSLLSKKSPDGVINKFKLKFINQLLTTSASLLNSAYLPFADFRVFDEETLPSNSDAIFIVNQYISCLEKLKFENIRYEFPSWYWRLSDSKELIGTTPPIDRYRSR